MKVAFYDPALPVVELCSLAEFRAANGDGLDEAELASLREPGDFILGGGGAAPEFCAVVVEPGVFEVVVAEDQIIGLRFGVPAPAPGTEEEVR